MDDEVAYDALASQLQITFLPLVIECDEIVVLLRAMDVLWYLPDEYGAGGELVEGGDLIRGKAAFYQRIWEHDEMGD